MSKIERDGAATTDQNAKKPYETPSLKELGSIAELTQGTGLVLLDIAVLGSITVTAAVFG